MAWATISSKRSQSDIDQEIADWETDVAPSSIDHIDTCVIGPNRVSIQLIYTA